MGLMEAPRYRDGWTQLVVLLCGTELCNAIGKPAAEGAEARRPHQGSHGNTIKATAERPCRRDHVRPR